MSNPLIYQKVILPIDDTAASPSIQMGGSSVASSGTGIRGDSTQVIISVAGSDIATINSSGINATISGTANRANNLSGGLGGQIPYQSAVNTTAMLANGTAGQVLASQGTTLAPHWVTPSAGFSILAFSSTATVGGAASEAVVVTGLLASDTILSVSQKTPGGAALPILGYSTQIDNGLTLIYSADMGSGAVVLVSVKR